MIKDLLKLGRLAKRHGGEIEIGLDGGLGDGKWKVVFTTRREMWESHSWFTVEDTSLSKALKQVALEVEEYYASHWRDDDSPEYECGYGVCGV